ncbi:AAA family ATPase [candidate division WOR-3 bacterium]|uniref:Replication-associated recombination protein A n=1 Tax=candidate division WOR-3 bacterium TaxID=2052148 RepID=A0A9D5K975_UNCW3|nr:AAA family ATPase [candidate division WOR-3 bacterium]MBD3364702.1 AAA family ATPase [candidate division WOR-3 bacterium]
MRPRTLDEFCGQEHLVGKGRPLRKLLESGHLPSMIFWGPPGSGKTSLAFLISRLANAEFVAKSAVTSGIKDVKQIVQRAKMVWKAHKRRTILFLDEIHRFNKAQQDAFLPHVERGTITLIGATTENPSFEVIGPLLSRSRVFVFNPLTDEDLKQILRQAMTGDRGLADTNPEASDEVLEFIIRISDGDARRALNALEAAVQVTEPDSKGKRVVTKEVTEAVLERKFMLYDKSGEEHYNLISAFIKSMRGSDADAAVYWLMRMIDSGEDPLYLARRMVILAGEDIGLADPQALVVANAAKDAVHFVGYPECVFHLTEAAIYLALAPKSNATLKAIQRARKDVQETQAEPVPLHLRNAPTRLMKDIGYGKEYQYPHSYEDGLENQAYRPSRVEGNVYYQPTDRGREAKLRERLSEIREHRRKSASKGKKPHDKHSKKPS